MRSVTLVGFGSERIRSNSQEGIWEGRRLLCRSEAVYTVFLEKGLMSWLQEEKVTRSGSGPSEWGRWQE